MSGWTIVAAYVCGWVAGSLVVARELGPCDTRMETMQLGALAFLAGTVWPVYLIGWVLVRAAARLPGRDDR